MKTNPLLRAIVILAILIITIGCDQVSKKIVREKMIDNQSVGFIHDHFIIEKVENTGAFLSLGDSASGALRMIFLNIIPIILVAISLVYILINTKLNKVTLLAIILMIGGGIGNIYDRLAHGSVTDFLYINFVIFHTGVFNVADMCIMAGIFIILIRSFLKERQKAEVSS
jgi:signal peptidase II